LVENNKREQTLPCCRWH